MAETTVNLGMLPNNRGNFEDLPSGSLIYKDNIVQYNGSSYIYDPANFNIDNPAASATTEPPYDDTPSSLNTGWKVFASGNNTFTTGETVNGIGIDSVPASGSTNLVKSGGVYSQISQLDQETNDLNIELIGYGVYKFASAVGEHSSANDQYEISLQSGKTITFKISLDTALVGENYHIEAKLFSASQQVVANQDYLTLDTEYQLTPSADAKYIGFYIYPVMTAGTFAVSLALPGRVDILEEKTEDNEERIEDIEFELDGEHKYTFSSSSGSHSSENDKIDVNIPARTAKLIKIETGTAVLGSTSTIDLKGFRADNGNLGHTLNGISSGVFYRFRPNFDINKISFYISGIATGGNFIVTVRDVESIENNIDELKNDTNNIIDTIDAPIGYPFKFTFDAAYGSHSYDYDWMPVNISAGKTVNIRVDAKTATMSSSHFCAVRFFKANGVAFYTSDNIELGTDNLFRPSQDVKFISVGITGIATTGSFMLTVRGVSEFDALNKKVEEYIGKDVPYYFESNVSNVVSKLRENSCFGTNGATFAFITDVHWEDNSKNSPAIIRRISDNINLDYVCFGGDAINGNANQALAKQYFSELCSGLKQSRLMVFSMFGNHDENANDGGVSFGKKPFYNLLQKQVDKVVSYGELNYFYYDNPTTKIRSIFLDTGRTYVLSDAQKTWYNNALETTPSGYSIIVFAHAIYKDQGAVGGQNTLLFSDAGTYVCERADYQNQEHYERVRLIVGGHMHLDLIESSPNGIPVIITDCDARQSYSGNPNTAGTINELAFDIMSADFTDGVTNCERIGRGKSRIVHHSPVRLSVNGTIDLASIKTLTGTLTYNCYDVGDLQLATSNYAKTFTHNKATISGSTITAVASGCSIGVIENEDTIEYFIIIVE